MLHLKDLDADQIDAVDRLFSYDETLLIAGTGAGKTIITLTAIAELLHAGVIKRVLIIAPLKVCNNVWRDEHTKWSHVTHLKVGIATGKDFLSVLSRANEYDVVVVNFDMVSKLVEVVAMGLFDGFVCDEGSKMAAGGVWFKRLRRFIKTFNWRLVMSATPIVEGWTKLFYQAFLCDTGKAFGRNREKWLKRYFYATDYNQRNWEIIPSQDIIVAGLVKHLTYVVPSYKAALPPFHVEHVTAPLPPATRQHYKDMCGKMETAGVLAETAAAKSMKLQQLASGFIYQEDKTAIRISEHKYEALQNILEKNWKMGVKNILIVYQFVEELERLRELYPDLVALGDSDSSVSDWNAGKIKLLAIHPASGSHGLNMAQGGHSLIWLSPCWSLDKFTQQNERLWRRGQNNAVTAFVIIAPDTIDNLILLRHESKSGYMPAFLAHLAAQTAA